MYNVSLHESASTFQKMLNELGYDNEVIQLPKSTRTAVEAAEAVGCDVDQIAKSIIFRLKSANDPLLVVASGKNRIDEVKIESYIDDSLGKADATFVRDRTGFVIGGVPPVGHTEKIMTFIDEDLFAYETIWAAAGHPMAVFPLTAEQLVEMTGGKVVRVK